MSIKLAEKFVRALHNKAEKFFNFFVKMNNLPERDCVKISSTVPDGNIIKFSCRPKSKHGTEVDVLLEQDFKDK